MVHVSRMRGPPHRRLTLAAPCLAMRIAASSLMLNAVIATEVLAQTAPTAVAQQAPDQKFSTEQLDALVASIALYPDDLLTQTLMAATFPLEVVAAARWV